MGRAARWFKGMFGTKKSKDRSHVSGGDSVKGGDHSGDFNVPRDSVLLGTILTDTEKDQNKNAIAVATATATAADAAVSAAVVRLTSEGRAGDIIITKEERWAAVKIQKVFRGSLVIFASSKCSKILANGFVKFEFLVMIQFERFSS